MPSWFSSVMAVWWLLAEAGLVLVAHWAWRYGTRRANPGFRWPAHFAITGVFLLGTALLLARYHHPFFREGSPELVALKRSGVWNFLCTTWVGLEAALAIYLGRLANVLGGGNDSPRRWTFPALVVFLVAGYFAYHSAILNIAESGSIASDGTRVLTIFYIRICGVFWVAIEFLCLYQLVRIRKEVLRGIPPAFARV